MPVWMDSAALSVTEPTFNPYLQSGALEISPGGPVALDGVTITAGGTGYNAGTLVFAGGGTGAAGTYTVVGNVINTVTVTAGGTGYPADVTVTPSHAGNGDAVLAAQLRVPFMDTGVLTIGNDIAAVYQMEGGGTYTVQQICILDGVDISHRVTSEPSWSVRQDDKYVRFSVTLDGDNLSYLDHADTEAGKSFVVNYLIQYPNGGTQFTKAMFTGTVQSSETSWSNDGTASTVLNVEDPGGDLDRHNNWTISLNNDRLPYGVVVIDEDQECLPVALNTTNTVKISAGVVIVDRGKVGQFGNPGGYPAGSANGWPFAGNGSSTYSENFIWIAIPETTVNLQNAINGELGGGDPWITEDALGDISVFVRNNGVIGASLLGSPPDGVDLCVVSRQFTTQVLTDERVRDTRTLAVDADRRTRAEILKIVLERNGVDTSELRLPTVNNDAIAAPIVVTPGKSLLQWCEDWCAPSNWSGLKYDGDGNPYVFLMGIDRGLWGVNWVYDQKMIESCRIVGPDKTSASADVTVRGTHRINRGLLEREETTELETRLKRPTSTGSGGFGLGGSYVQYGDTLRDDKLRTVRKENVTRVYLGGTVVLTTTRVKILKNPLDYRGYRPGAGISASGERGLNYIGTDEDLRLDSIVIDQQVYVGRVHQGYTIVTKQYYNPINLDYNAGITLGQTPPYAYRQSVGGVEQPPFYGFQFPDEQLTLVSITEHSIDSGNSGFVSSATTKHWVMSNPHVQGEGAPNNNRPFGPGNALAAIGSHNVTEELILVSENVESWKRLNSEELELRKSARGWRKKGAGVVHNGLKAGHGPSMGHTQGQLASETKELEVLRSPPASLPAVGVLADDVDVIPVGARVASSSIASALAITDNVVNEELEYAESTEQCSRVAHRWMGEKLSVDWHILVPLNPAIQLGHTIRIPWETREGVNYNARGVVRGISPALAIGPLNVASMMVTVSTDYNASDMRTNLAARI